MTAFTYEQGVLTADGVSLAAIAAAVGTPTYVYAASAIERAYGAYREALGPLGVHIHFALKANGNLAVVNLLAGLGAGADIVSEGEMLRALAAGVPPGRIIFSGVGKTATELEAALAADIGQINLESVAELDALAAIARRMGKRPRVAIRINPDVDAGTHRKIATGRKESKFGVPIEQVPAAYRRATESGAMEPVGIALHIGSQLTDLAPFRAAYEKAAALVRALRAEGLPVRLLDLGGGMGVTYRDEEVPDLRAYAAMLRETVGDLDCALAVEPGRSLVASAGLLLTRLLYRKPKADGEIWVLDAAMNDLLRPSMYEAYHPLLPVEQPVAGTAEIAADLVGPICESGDTFARDRRVPQLDEGALVALGVVGAYGFSMASTYNSRPLAAEIMARKGAFAVIRPRQTLNSLFATERMPQWRSA